MKRGSGWYVGTTKTGRRVLAAAGTKSAREVKKQPGTRWYATREEAERASNPRKGRAASFRITREGSEYKLTRKGHVAGYYPTKKAAKAAALGKAIRFGASENPKGSHTHRIALNNPVSIKKAIERAAKAVKSGGRVVVRLLKPGKNPTDRRIFVVRQRKRDWNSWPSWVDDTFHPTKSEATQRAKILRMYKDGRQVRIGRK